MKPHEIAALLMEMDKEKGRKEKASKRIRMLRDDFLGPAQEYLKKYLVKTESHDKLKEILNDTINIFKSVIEEISLVYVDSPRRMFTGNEGHIKTIEEIYKKASIDLKMDKVNRLVNACNDVLLQVRWTVDDLGKAIPGIDIITPNICSVKCDRNLRPEMVLIDKEKQEFVQGNDKVYKTEKTPLTIVWTKDRHFMVNNKSYQKEKKATLEKISINEKDENPYGFLPFIDIHKEIPDSSFFDETSGNDVYKITLVIACLQTFIDSYFTWNSFKQLMIKSEDPPGVVCHSPDTVVHLKGQDDEGQVLDFQIHLKELFEALRELITQVCQNYGVDWNSLSMKIKEGTGKAIKAKSSKLCRIWKKQIKTYQDAEMRLFEMIKKVYEVHTGTKLDVEMSITFAYEEIQRDEKEELEILEKKLDLNLIDFVDALMERNKGIKNYEEGKKRLADIIKMNNDFRGQVEDPVDKIFEKTKEKDAA